MRGSRRESGRASATTPAEQQHDPRPLSRDDRPAGPVDRERPVEPVDGFAQAVAAVEHADVLDARAERGAARGAAGRVAVGDAGDGLGRGGRQPDRPQRLALQHALPAADDDQQVARLGGGHRRREHRDGDGRPDAGRRLREAHDDVRGHGVAEHGQAAVAERAGEGRDPCGLVDERPGRAVGVGDASGERRGIARVAGEIEGHGDVAVPRQGRSRRTASAAATPRTRARSRRRGPAGRTRGGRPSPGSRPRVTASTDSPDVADRSDPEPDTPIARIATQNSAEVEEPPAPSMAGRRVRPPPPRRSGRGFARDRSAATA